MLETEINLLEEYQNIQKLKVVEKWIKEHPNEYFATTVHEWHVDEFDGEQYSTVKGFDLKVELPFKAISIEINSTYPNVPSYHCDIIFLLSKKFIRFFYFITNYTNQSWDTKTMNTKDIQWITLEFKIADHGALIEGIEQIKDSFQARIEKDLQEKFNIPATPEKDDDDLPF